MEVILVLPIMCFQAGSQVQKEQNAFEMSFSFQVSINSINLAPALPLLGSNPSSHRYPTAQAAGPATSLSPTLLLHSHQDPEPEAEPQPEPDGKWVLCNYDFQARNSSELSVKQQDVLEVRGCRPQGLQGPSPSCRPRL